MPSSRIAVDAVGKPIVIDDDGHVWRVRDLVEIGLEEERGRPPSDAEMELAAKSFYTAPGEWKTSARERRRRRQLATGFATDLS